MLSFQLWLRVLDTKPETVEHQYLQMFLQYIITWTTIQSLNAWNCSVPECLIKSFSKNLKDKKSFKKVFWK